MFKGKLDADAQVKEAIKRKCVEQQVSPVAKTF